MFRRSTTWPARPPRRLAPGRKGRSPRITARFFLLAVASLLLLSGGLYIARTWTPQILPGVPAPGFAPPAALSFEPETGLLSIEGRAVGSAVRLPDGSTYRFPTDFVPTDSGLRQVTTVRDEILGLARRIRADYASADQALAVTIEVVVADRRPAMLYQMQVHPTSGVAAPERYVLLDEGYGGLALSGPIEYLALVSTGAVQGSVAASRDSFTLPLPEAVPVMLWSEAARHGYVLALLDESLGRRSLRLSYSDPGDLRLRLETGARDSISTVSPRLFIERTDTRDLTRAFAGYRAALDVIAPAPPIPATFRQQWDSWYVYGGEITEERIRQQIDTIASSYRDVGPWQIVVDAGWYLASSDPDGEIGKVDPTKFPSGMRALVDYAHQRGVGVVLYGSAPWVDSDPSIASWWVVQLGFVRDHQDWLILVSGGEEGATYVYDLSNPELRAYLAGLIRRYLIEFDADGILLDMVGVIGPEGGPFRGEVPGPPGARRPPLRDGPFRGQPSAAPGAARTPPELAQTMEIYRSLWQTARRLNPEVWIESGYATPPLARSYAHTWRLADDYPAFSHPYPLAGLLEQITYAVLQQQILGRRPHLGFIYGGAETLPIQRQWLGAAVALQAQTVLSTDLTSVSTEAARMYRGYLAALRPFSATPVFGPGIPPEAFSTTVDGTTYLGLLNQAEEARTIIVDLAEHGLPADARVLAFDPETGAITSGRYLAAQLPARSFRLLAMRTNPGVLWADRGWTAEQAPGTLRIRVDPGPVDGGHLQIYAPGAREVTIEGAPGSEWTLDFTTGMLTVDVPDGTRYRIDVALPGH